MWIHLLVENVILLTEYQQAASAYYHSFHQCNAEMYHCLEAQHPKPRKHFLAYHFQWFRLQLVAQNLPQNLRQMRVASTFLQLTKRWSEALRSLSSLVSVLVERVRTTRCFVSFFLFFFSFGNFLISLQILFLLSWYSNWLGFIVSRWDWVALIALWSPRVTRSSYQGRFKSLILLHFYFLDLLQLRRRLGWNYLRLMMLRGYFVTRRKQLADRFTWETSYLTMKRSGGSAHPCRSATPKVTPQTRTQTSEQGYTDIRSSNKRSSTPCSRNTSQSFHEETGGLLSRVRQNKKMHKNFLHGPKIS